jgi:hypothetical protein
MTALTGSLAASIEPWLADATRHRLVAPLRDAAESASDLTASRCPR